MRAAILYGDNDIRLGEAEHPICGPDDMILQVMACGICGSDLRIIKHGNARVKPPAVLGHEVAGVVAEVGENVRGYAIGDRLCFSSDVPCGVCEYCRGGSCNNCVENFAIGHQLPGGFAEYMPVGRLIWDNGPCQKIPDRMSYDEAALAEPLACALNGFDIMPIRRKDAFVVIGGGVLGALWAQIARTAGFQKIIVVDTDEKKLSLLRELNIGVTHLFLFDPFLFLDIKKATDGRGADAVVTACSDQRVQSAAMEIVATRGVVNWFAGLPASASGTPVSSHTIHYKEVTLTGSHGSTPAHHARAVKLIADGQIRVAPLVSHTYSLENFAEAFATSARNDRLKVMIHPNG